MKSSTSNVGDRLSLGVNLQANVLFKILSLYGPYVLSRGISFSAFMPCVYSEGRNSHL